MSWHGLLFVYVSQTISCCTIWNHAYNTLYIRVGSIHSPTDFLLQACTFLCNFLSLHKHRAGWLWDNENVSAFFFLSSKEKQKQTLPLETGSEFSSLCWNVNCERFVANDFSDRPGTESGTNWQTCRRMTWRRKVLSCRNRGERGR